MANDQTKCVRYFSGMTCLSCINVFAELCDTDIKRDILSPTVREFKNDSDQLVRTMARKIAKNLPPATRPLNSRELLKLTLRFFFLILFNLSPPNVGVH